MPDARQFVVRDWGVTGSFASPLLPEAVQQKIVESIRLLSEDVEFRQRINEHRLDPTWLRDRIQSTIPFAWRSTFGGNTTCIEVQVPGALIIVHAGSGFCVWATSSRDAGTQRITRVIVSRM